MNKNDGQDRAGQDHQAELLRQVHSLSKEIAQACRETLEIEKLRSLSAKYQKLCHLRDVLLKLEAQQPEVKTVQESLSTFAAYSNKNASELLLH